MADFYITGRDAAIQVQSLTSLGAGVDEDLIDYDSDDVSTKDPGLGHMTDRVDAKTLELSKVVIEETPILEDVSDLAETRDDTAPLPDTTSPEVVEAIHVAGEQQQDHEGIREYALGDENTAGNSSDATLVGPARDSIHEIDYDDGFTFESNPSGDNQQHSIMAHENIQSPLNPSLEQPTAAQEKTRATHYEIDWEDDNDGVDQTIQEDTAQAGTQAAAANAHADSNYQDAEASQDSFGAEDDASEEAEHLMPAEEHTEPEPFPNITVLYRGEEFPFFSLSPDGFFSDVSILDETMETVLNGLRTELTDEIGPNDDLVFQVDKLGLEFSEVGLPVALHKAPLTLIQSSPRGSLSEISLRQILEVLDLLVKNTDQANSRVLYTYLFTRPNVSKRFEFLVQCTTGDTRLAEVMYSFQAPSQGNAVQASGDQEGHQEGLDGGESASDDAAARTSRDNTDAYEDAAFDDVGYDYDEAQDGHEASWGQGSVAPSAGDKLVAAGDEHKTGSVSPEAETGANHDNDTVEHVIDDDANEDENGAVAELFDDQSAADEDPDLVGTFIDEEEHDSRRRDDGGPSVFDHRTDPDLIDYSSAGDKNVGDDDDILANLPSIGNENTEEVDSGAVSYKTSDRVVVADENLIDYEGVGDGDVGAHQGEGDSQHVSLRDMRRDGDIDATSVKDDHGNGADDRSGDQHVAPDEYAPANFDKGDDDQVSLEAGVTTELEEGSALTEDPGLLLVTSDSHAHGDGAAEIYLDIDLGGPEATSYAGWEGTQMSASMDHYSPGQGGRGTSGTENSSTTATLGDGLSAHGEAAMGLDPVYDTSFGFGAEAPPRLKRAYSSEADGEDGNDKRRNLGEGGSGFG